MTPIVKWCDRTRRRERAFVVIDTIAGSDDCSLVSLSRLLLSEPPRTSHNLKVLKVIGAKNRVKVTPTHTDRIAQRRVVGSSSVSVVVASNRMPPTRLSAPSSGCMMPQALSSEIAKSAAHHKKNCRRGRRQVNVFFRDAKRTAARSDPRSRKKKKPNPQVVFSERSEKKNPNSFVRT